MPYFTQLADTLLVDDVDICALDGIVVGDLAGLHAPGTRRGMNDVIPGRRGQLGASKPLDAYAFAVPVTVLADNASGVTAATLAGRRSQMLANLRGLTAAVVSNGGQVILTRRLTSGAGYIETRAGGELVDGMAVDLLNAVTGQTELNFINLDGCWYAVTDASLAPGAVTVAGDVPTRRIILDLPGAGTLANTTTGQSVTVTTAAVLDVQHYDASAGLATMTTAGPDHAWFVLNPGANTITWSGAGTPSVLYRAAYL